jgi:GntR family transcriptional repressor for pyruvate dehydrogenase complex
MTFPPIFEQIEPLNRKPVAERVANRLLELIRSGNLRAGDKLPTENELGAAMHVSRPIIREALRSLSILGVVESRQGGRCYVTDLTPSRLLAPLQMVIAVDETNVDALFEARVAVEGELLRIGVTRIGDEDLARLSELVRTGYDLVADPVGFRVMDMEFHTLLIRLAANPFLERMAQTLYELGIEYRRAASETPGVLESSAREHDGIVTALHQRDADRVVAAMGIHLDSIRRTTFEAMQKVGAARLQQSQRISLT